MKKGDMTFFYLAVAFPVLKESIVELLTFLVLNHLKHNKLKFFAI